MEIDFGSHTDSRGSDVYNKNLSQRRTDAAKAYLVQKGIAANRVVASGYGEDRLLNQCKNGVKCSDEEHQMNRRTEVKVIKINEENVEVRKGN
jgi:outer membrane protein OmpA-like peptidoglycan-associated protein